MARIKLFCFPYAGGSTQMYHHWKQSINPGIELIPIELAGRGKRFNDPLYRDFNELITDVFQQIQSDIGKGPYAFFGHSLGALISFELVHKIMAEKLPFPNHVFYSGKSAPNTQSKRKFFYYLLEPEQFKEEIIKLGGTPPEIFEHSEFENLFLPLLKNDFKMAECYSFIPGRKLYSGDITVLLGKDDSLSAEQCHSWSTCTSGICKIIYFNGGHFFINNESKNVINIINDTLT